MAEDLEQQKYKYMCCQSCIDVQEPQERISCVLVIHL